MKMFLKMIILFFILLVPSQIVLASKVPIYLFYGDTCPVCEREREYLNELKQEYDNIVIHEFEVYRNRTNYQNMLEVKEMFSITRDGVPFTVIGDTSILGFGDSSKDRFEYLVKQYTKDEYYRDRTGIYLGYIEEKEVPTTEEIKTTHYEQQEKNENKETLTINRIIIFSLLLILITFILLILGYYKRK